MGMHFKENEEKITLSMIVGGIIIIGILLTSLIVYLLNINSSKVNEEYSIGKENIIQDVTLEDQFEDVTSEIGKSVNEAMENLTEGKNTVPEMSTNNTNVQNETINKEANASIEENTEKNIETKKQDKVEASAKTVKEDKKEENKEEKNAIQFTKPTNGEIIREFAPDSLVYSETLKEWITHNGVDIKADKASEVVASSDGKVTSIKNDPRYGLTVIIDHNDGMRTVYANLLSAENVVEGEEVTTGQTIGTVGNSANFEIADDYHLHFEILKDGDYVDPLQFIK